METRQISLKPQDVVLAIKLAVNQGRAYTFAQLGSELCLSASEAHAAFARAERARLTTRLGGSMATVASSLQEFILHGLSYVFPPVIGPVARGLLTGIGAPPLSRHFAPGGEGAWVWPDPQGRDRGPSLLPLYPTVPSAARHDALLYEMLVCVDALRAGAARDREFAAQEIRSRL